MSKNVKDIGVKKKAVGYSPTACRVGHRLLHSLLVTHEREGEAISNGD